MSSTREVHSVAYILKNDGVLPHQNSPFGRKSRNESSHSLTNFGFHKHKYAIQGIEKVDLNGYKFLRQPLRIEYCQITKRWMFSSEIRTRKVIVPMCRDLNCMAKDMSLCGKTVDMELFCLDDAESWVVIGKGGRGHLSRRWEKHLGENGRLYCVDEKTECMRRQTVEEVKASRLRLEREKGKFGFFEEDASYMAVVRYLEKE
ncbi:uncharacterized protein LY89DRAFT_681460 [Mollisia scopiformis]|uniref:Uncharacterized protein n=1 Tax=Mollisia scopiformis TaxID=149040 RepID=A0A194XQY4_MOLSC|nr:uncharacterized protein LY89DRAFT_681460 [Mollisia scopiformis]KUJ22142.1 hypothetical protein LY89DRAFT_681460 [Mollisia scopiformis]